MSATGPILVVSNRLPVTLTRGKRGLERRRSSGGLVSGLEPLMLRNGGTWIGWPGIKLQPGDRLSSPEDPFQMRAVEISNAEITRYYHGFSNRTLWPLFHCFPSLATFERREWETYERVNERFARVAADCADEDGAELVWFHDYQLTTAPHHLRRMRPEQRIAQFIHIPFPPDDVFRLLPWNRELLLGLLACDLVGFHVPLYARNFMQCAERMLGARVDFASGQIEQGERTVLVRDFALGIDYERFASAAAAVPRRDDRGGQPKERLILGVDRLDYTKGIPERMRAFERLLDRHPEHREKIGLLQIAVPSRNQVAAYQDQKREIDELVGRINGRFGTSQWTPIRYLYRSVPQERLVELYRDADIALVTPLRDGMNLVAKEYVACQVGEPGVLILSRLAGAAETMREALQVNPANIDGVADALHRALTMEEPERRSRMVALQRRERKYDVHRWLESFVEAARGAGGHLQTVTDAEFESWLGRVLDNHRLALFLDYDGTLVPLRRHPSEARLPENVRDSIAACARRPDTDVSIVSGRALEDVRSLAGLEDVTYAGNHGLEIEGPGLEHFRHADLPHYRERLVDLATELGQGLPPGAWVEEKGASLTLHFREAEPDVHESLATEARAQIRKAGFQARDAQRAVEARPPIGWDKGHAVLHILRKRYGPSWSENVRPIYIGDDDTDEDAFRVLSGLGMTFLVGQIDRPTQAARSLANPENVRALLAWLARR